MDCVATAVACDVDQPAAIEIRGGARASERDRVVGDAYMQGCGVFARMDGDARCAVLGGCTQHADRDLAAVRYQDAGNHLGAATPR